MSQQVLDPIPVWGVFIAISAVLLLVFELGFRVGHWWQVRTPDEREGPTQMLVGSLLALLAFLLAVTMGMASDRFDGRRQLVLNEANAIGTAYLRAGYLPGTASDASRQLLKEYVPLRINTPDAAQRDANFSKSVAIQNSLWSIATQVATDQPNSPMVAIYIESLNDVIDISESRVTALVYARVPQTILTLLIILAALTMGMVGYSAGLTRKRSAVTAVVLVFVLAAVLTLVVDLDRPTEGFLQVSQQPLLDLQQQIGTP